MLTAQEFIDRYPAFRAIPVATINTALADAANRTDADLFGDMTAEAHGTLAASILHGQIRQAVRTAPGEKPEAGADIYLKRRKELEGLCGGFQGGVV